MCTHCNTEFLCTITGLFLSWKKQHTNRSVSMMHRKKKILFSPLLPWKPLFMCSYFQSASVNCVLFALSAFDEHDETSFTCWCHRTEWVVSPANTCFIWATLALAERQEALILRYWFAELLRIWAPYKHPPPLSQMICQYSTMNYCRVTHFGFISHPSLCWKLINFSGSKVFS